MNPAELGYFEKRPGSGVWYRPGTHKTTYAPETCEGCGREKMIRRGRRFCSRSCGARKPDALYKSRHIRVRKARGKASEQACVDCGKPAREWSQTHSTTGQEPEHYQPRCRKCHAAYDQSGEDNSSAKLTEARVRGIRASVGANGRELAEIHGVTQMTISRVLRGKIWRHVK